jgi:hypothetical protein
MKNSNKLIEKLEQTDLSDEDKELLKQSLIAGGWQKFLLTLFKVFSISKEILDSFGVGLKDIKEIIDKFL